MSIINTFVCLCIPSWFSYNSSCRQCSFVRWRLSVCFLTDMMNICDIMYRLLFTWAPLLHEIESLSTAQASNWTITYTHVSLYLVYSMTHSGIKQRFKMNNWCSFHGQSELLPFYWITSPQSCFIHSTIEIGTNKTCCWYKIRIPTNSVSDEAERNQNLWRHLRKPEGTKSVLINQLFSHVCDN